MTSSRASSTWIFGYGSLIWRPNFPFIRRCIGFVEGWERRFWQASPDHRGTPEAPGRVVTLTRSPSGTCWGTAFEISPDHAPDIVRALDGREQAGYERAIITIERDGDEPLEHVLTYIAHPGNPHFAGPASEEAIARQIAAARGPSGTNMEYLLRLSESLETIAAPDAHVDLLSKLVRGVNA